VQQGGRGILFFINIYTFEVNYTVAFDFYGRIY
jgi:hypothetical protein